MSVFTTTNILIANIEFMLNIYKNDSFHIINAYTTHICMYVCVCVREHLLGQPLCRYSRYNGEQVYTFVKFTVLWDRC